VRGDLNTGGSSFCGDCPLKLPLAGDASPPVRPLDAGPLPSRLYIECTAACNISCFEACCAPETGITRTRQAGMLDFDLFTRVVNETGPSLARIDFFNYGETFLHKRAVEMCEYIKQRFPQVYLYTSTNGLALSVERSRRLVHSPASMRSPSRWTERFPTATRGIDNAASSMSPCAPCAR
jgi:MoaA/NifB/PqqE/SkfB family radical SAM enzyme